MRRPFRAAPLLLALAALAAPAGAFELSGDRWPGGEATFHVSIVEPQEGAVDLESGLSWNEAFEDELARWSGSTPFEFRIVDSVSEPCGADSRNGVGFAADACGDAFGTGGLAVTVSASIGATRIESDIVFNANESWSIDTSPFGADAEFRRVALHELGHALGLGHEEDVPSIMRPTIGSTASLQPDDVAGTEALYGPCPAPSPLASGAVRPGRLEVTDCFSTELPFHDQVDALADRYAVEIGETSTLRADLRSGAFDARLFLLAGGGALPIAVDDDGGAGTNARIVRTLEPGSYQLAASSYYEGETGGYSLEATFVPEPGAASGALAALAALAGLARGRARRVAAESTAA